MFTVIKLNECLLEFHIYILRKGTRNVISIEIETVWVLF